MCERIGLFMFTLFFYCTSFSFLFSITPNSTQSLFLVLCPVITTGIVKGNTHHAVVVMLVLLISLCIFPLTLPVHV